MNTYSLKFHETQKFTQWWLLIIIISPIFLTILKMGLNINEQLKSDSAFLSIGVKIPLINWVGVLIYVLTILFVLFSKLVVHITDNEIRIRDLIFFKKNN